MTPTRSRRRGQLALGAVTVPEDRADLTRAGLGGGRRLDVSALLQHITAFVPIPMGGRGPPRPADRTRTRLWRSERSRWPGGSGRNAELLIAAEPLPVKDPVIAALRAAVALDVPDPRVEHLVLGHLRIRAEVERGDVSPADLGLRELEQRPACAGPSDSYEPGSVVVCMRRVRSKQSAAKRAGLARSATRWKEGRAAHQAPRASRRSRSGDGRFASHSPSWPGSGST